MLRPSGYALVPSYNRYPCRTLKYPIEPNRDLKNLAPLRKCGVEQFLFTR